MSNLEPSIPDAPKSRAEANQAFLKQLFLDPLNGG